VRVDILSIFPEVFEGPLGVSMVGIAQERGLLEVHAHDLRDWTHDRHRTTDDAPYGGGPGMVMKPEPVFDAVEAIQTMAEVHGEVVILAPTGARLTQPLVEQLSRVERLVLVCGRYEGFDERIMALADHVVSIGDYVLTGGELPAMVLVDAVCRHIPGVLGHDQSAADETFTENLLEYPQYTRPAVYRGLEVPEVLLSGDHARIAAWRRDQSIRRTARLRPDLLAAAPLTEAERRVAAQEAEADRSEEGP